MRELAKQLIPCLDLTELSGSETSADIMVLCENAVCQYGEVAAVCIYSQWLQVACSALQDCCVAVATVVNFPKPTMSIEQLGDAIAAVVADGADEIDVVMPYDLLRQGGHSRVDKILQHCRQAAAGRVLKVIIESGELTSLDLIAEATELVVARGAEFVKTSTGKTAVGATLPAVETMLKVLQQHNFSTGIKLSGGIRTMVQAYEFVQLVERYMGNDWQNPQRFRIGASSLLQDIIRQIEQTAF